MKEMNPGELNRSAQSNAMQYEIYFYKVVISQLLLKLRKM